MVVPYKAFVQRITSASATHTPEPAGAPAGGSEEQMQQMQQMHFLGLLQEAGRQQRETHQRALHVESQVQQLRQLFQQWQLQLQEQWERQQEQVLQKMQLMQQQQIYQQLNLGRQVHKQLQDLFDSVNKQRAHHYEEHDRVQRQLKEVYSFQQLHASNQRQQVGRLQQQLRELQLHQRVERRNRQVLERQLQQAKKSQPIASEPRGVYCPQDDCCPCEYPQECPFNPYFPTDNCCQAEEPEEGDCLLRNIRLGFVETPSCKECEFLSSRQGQSRRKANYFEESEAGYMADDEASMFSEVSSGHSSSFKVERRQILQEVRDLENTRLLPRYEQTWKPLRCFRCGELGHLATFCHTLPSTVL